MCECIQASFICSPDSLFPYMSIVSSLSSIICCTDNVKRTLSYRTSKASLSKFNFPLGFTTTLNQKQGLHKSLMWSCLTQILSHYFLIYCNVSCPIFLYIHKMCSNSPFPSPSLKSPYASCTTISKSSSLQGLKFLHQVLIWLTSAQTTLLSTFQSASLSIKVDASL